jgi:hypothetical protein
LDLMMLIGGAEERLTQVYTWYLHIVTAIQSVLKVALPKYLVVITRRCKMWTENAGQKFEQFL